MHVYLKLTAFKVLDEARIDHHKVCNFWLRYQLATSLTAKHQRCHRKGASMDNSSHQKLTCEMRWTVASGTGPTAHTERCSSDCVSRNWKCPTSRSATEREGAVQALKNSLAPMHMVKSESQTRAINLAVKSSIVGRVERLTAHPLNMQ